MQSTLILLKHSQLKFFNIFKKVFIITISQFLCNQHIKAENLINLTLEKAMDMAEDNSFIAKMSGEDINTLEAQGSGAVRSFFPTVVVSGQYLRNSDSVNKLVGTPIGQSLGLPDTTTSVAQAKLTQPLMGLNALFLTIEGIGAATRAANHNNTRTHINARYLGATAYITTQQAEQLLKVAESSVEVSEKQLHDGEAQYNAGKLTNADLLKFKLNLENSKTNLVRAQTTYKVALLTLGEAIGITDTRTISFINNREKSAWESKETKIPIELNFDNPTAFSEREDILAAKESIEASRYSKFVSVSSYLPTVNFVATYARNFNAKDATISGKNYIKKDIQDTFSYGLEFSWLLLDWGVRQAQIGVAAAAEQKARYNLEYLNSQARIDVTNSYLQLKGAVQTLDSARVSVQFAQDEYEQVKARFDNGQVTATDLVTAANDQTAARANLANTRANLDLAWISYKKSIGGKLTIEN